MRNNKETKCEKHVLVCKYHASEKANRDLLAVYKNHLSKLNGNLQKFSKEISISCFAETDTNGNQPQTSEDNSIFAFQTIDIDGLSFNLFYDAGCGDLVISKECCDKLSAELTLNFLAHLLLRGLGSKGR